MTDQQDDPTQFKENWPFYWISQVNFSYVEALDKRLRTIGVDIPSWRAMMSLYEDQYLSVSEIAAFSAQKLNTTTKVVQRMMHEDLVSTRVRPTDGRVTEVCLTNKGDDLRRQAFDLAQDVFEQTFSGISKRQISGLNQLLSTLDVRLKDL